MSKLLLKVVQYGLGIVKRIWSIPSTPMSVKKTEPVVLSQEQIQILKLVEDGHSVFYTGSAGMRSSFF